MLLRLIAAAHRMGDILNSLSSHSHGVSLLLTWEMGPLPGLYRRYIDDTIVGVMARCFEAKCIVMSRLSARAVQFARFNLDWDLQGPELYVKTPVFGKRLELILPGAKDKGFSIRIVSLYSAGLSLPLTIKISLVSLSFHDNPGPLVIRVSLWHGYTLSVNCVNTIHRVCPCRFGTGLWVNDNDIAVNWVGSALKNS